MRAYLISISNMHLKETRAKSKQSNHSMKKMVRNAYTLLLKKKEKIEEMLNVL